MTSDHEDVCQRAEKYISSAKEALDRLKRFYAKEGPFREDLKVDVLIDSAERYINDSKYYLDVKDCSTALAAVSYAEGLIDSLKYLGLVELEWSTQLRKKKVFVAGTFEIIHPGHIRLLEYASKYGEVYVIVARDSTVIRTKGRRPIIPENVRLEVVRSIRYVKEAYLGHPTDMLASVGRIRPDVIVLGPDQPFKEDELADMIEKRFKFRPEVVRLPEKFKFNDDMISVRDIYRRVCKEFCRENLS